MKQANKQSLDEVFMQLIQRAQQAILVAKNRGPYNEIVDVLSNGTTPPSLTQDKDIATSLRDIENRHILKIFGNQKEDVTATSRILKISRQTLYKRLKELGVK